MSSLWFANDFGGGLMRCGFIGYNRTNHVVANDESPSHRENETERPFLKIAAERLLKVPHLTLNTIVIF